MTSGNAGESRIPATGEGNGGPVRFSPERLARAAVGTEITTVDYRGGNWWRRMLPTEDFQRFWDDVWSLVEDFGLPLADDEPHMEGNIQFYPIDQFGIRVLDIMAALLRGHKEAWPPELLEELPAAVGRGRQQGNLDLAEFLRKNPGKWAAYPKGTVKSSASSLGSRIRNGEHASFRPGFEAEVHKGTLYIRFIGESHETGEDVVEK